MGHQEEIAQQPNAPAQPPTIEEKLARVFQEWERPDRPGGVAAIIEKGKVIYKKCFGQANVEYQIATTPKTAFDVGQLAEVITGMAIATLEEQGKLAAADPVKNYLADVFTLSTSLAGLPGRSVPAGFGDRGRPVGLQLIGPWFAEGRLLAVAHRLQQASDWHQQRAPHA